MTFAFIIMGNFDPWQDRAAIHNGDARMVGVADLKQACQAARELCAAGVECIELRGAFGEEGARRIIEATGGSVPVGYVTHLPQQDPLYAAVFGQ